MRTLVALLVLCATACATAVSGKAVDPNGNPYTGTVSAFLLAYSPPTSGGKSVNRSIGPFALAADGSFVLSMVGTDIIDPPGSVWQFTFCGPSVPNLPYNQSQIVCFDAQPIPITGSSEVITGLISPYAKQLGPVPQSTLYPFGTDIRKLGADCSGVADSAPAFNSLQSYNKYLAPPGCKLRIGPTGVNLFGLTSWEFDGSGTWADDANQTEIFGCGAGSGAVIKVNHSSNWAFHGARVVAGDSTLCPAGTTFTGSFLWEQVGAGITSTHAKIYDAAFSPGTGTPTGGIFFPVVGVTGGLVGPNAQNGSNVAYLQQAPGHATYGLHQNTATAIVNTTVYTFTAQVTQPNWPNFITFTGGSAQLALTGCTGSCNSASTTVLQASPCTTLTLGTWTALSVSFTGTVGTAGQTLGVSLLNCSTVTTGFGEIWFDNITGTNTGAISNQNFETPTLPNNGNGTTFPGVPSWSYVSSAAPYIGLQIGSGTVASFGGDQNLEFGELRNVNIFGGGTPNAIDIFAPCGNCQSWVLDHINIQQAYWGIAGALGFVAIGGEGGDGGFSNYGLGGGTYAAAGCSAGSATFIDFHTDENSGPFLQSMYSGLAGAPIGCDSITLINLGIGGDDLPPGGYAFDTAAANNGRITVLGGNGSTNGAIAAWAGSANSSLGLVPVQISNFKFTPTITTIPLCGAHVSCIDPTYANGVSAILSCADTSTSSTAYACTVGNGPFATFAYTQGLLLVLNNINQANSGAPTLTVNTGGGALTKPIKKSQGTAALVANDLLIHGTAIVVYDTTCDCWQKQ